MNPVRLVFPALVLFAGCAAGPVPSTAPAPARAPAVVQVAAAVTESTITAFFSAGETCDGAGAVSFVPGGVAAKISLCVRSPQDWLCGSTVKLEAGDAADRGALQLIALKYGPGLTDPNTGIRFPHAIVSPAPMIDLGATGDNMGVAPSEKRLIATYQIGATTAAGKPSYVLKLSTDSSLGVRRGGSCGNAVDAPLRATIAFTRA